jgi:hypothetical protein
MCFIRPDQETGRGFFFGISRDFGNKHQLQRRQPIIWGQPMPANTQEAAGVNSGIILNRCLRERLSFCKK